MLLLCSCSLLKNRTIKNTATELWMHDFEQVLDNEQSAIISGRNVRGKDFAKYVSKRTEIEILDLKEINDKDVVVLARMKTVSPEARKIVLEILSVRDSGAAGAFNFSDGLNLIHHEKPDLKIESDKDLEMELQEKDGEWRRTK